LGQKAAKRKAKSKATTTPSDNSDLEMSEAKANERNLYLKCVAKAKYYDILGKDRSNMDEEELATHKMICKSILSDLEKMG
jgi:hypothetical protein